MHRFICKILFTLLEVNLKHNQKNLTVVAAQVLANVSTCEHYVKSYRQSEVIGKSRAATLISSSSAILTNSTLGGSMS